MTARTFVLDQNFPELAIRVPIPEVQLITLRDVDPEIGLQTRADPDFDRVGRLAGDAQRVLRGRQIREGDPVRVARAVDDGGVGRRGERIANLAVSRPEVSLKIDAPDLVRCGTSGERASVRRGPPSTLTSMDEATAPEHGADTDAVLLDAGLTWEELLQLKEVGAIS